MSKVRTFERLSERDERWLATQIHCFLETLRNDQRQYAWAYALIDELLWFWTADAVYRGNVRRDAIKTDIHYLHSTNAARKSLEGGAVEKEDKVQHEHAGERTEIIAVLKDHGRSPEDVLDILRHLNVAVLVTH